MALKDDPQVLIPGDVSGAFPMHTSEVPSRVSVPWSGRACSIVCLMMFTYLLNPWMSLEMLPGGLGLWL
eukprot:4478568-Pyramimonas_sp.AAC.1